MNVCSSFVFCMQLQLSMCNIFVLIADLILAQLMPIFESIRKNEDISKYQHRRCSEPYHSDAFGASSSCLSFPRTLKPNSNWKPVYQWVGGIRFKRNLAFFEWKLCKLLEKQEHASSHSPSKTKVCVCAHQKVECKQVVPMPQFAFLVEKNNRMLHEYSKPHIYHDHSYIVITRLTNRKQAL